MNRSPAGYFGSGRTVVVRSPPWERSMRMSTVFGLPCPGCGEQMATTADGDVECVACDRRYHAGMGHLFPLVEPA
jgi:hypothetical protein